MQSVDLHNLHSLVDVDDDFGPRPLRGTHINNHNNKHCLNLQWQKGGKLSAPGEKVRQEMSFERFDELSERIPSST